MSEEKKEPQKIDWDQAWANMSVDKSAPKEKKPAPKKDEVVENEKISAPVVPPIVIPTGTKTGGVRGNLNTGSSRSSIVDRVRRSDGEAPINMEEEAIRMAEAQRIVSAMHSGKVTRVEKEKAE